LIHLALCLGCRRGELVALRWSDIDLKRQKIKIAHSVYKLAGTEEALKGPKNKSSIRTLSVPEYCCRLLTAYHAEQAAERIKLGTLWKDNDFVFTQWNGKVMNPDTVSQWFSAFLKRHKLPHVKFHALRHSSATLALQSGANISSLWLHTSGILSPAQRTVISMLWNRPTRQWPTSLMRCLGKPQGRKKAGGHKPQSLSFSNKPQINPIIQNQNI
jgi:integrase